MKHDENEQNHNKGPAGSGSEPNGKSQMKKIIYLIFSLLALSAQAQQQTHPPKLTPAERIAVIDTLVAKINALYVYEELAKQMTAANWAVCQISLAATLIDDAKAKHGAERHESAQNATEALQKAQKVLSNKSAYFANMIAQFLQDAKSVDNDGLK